MKIWSLNSSGTGIISWTEKAEALFLMSLRQNIWTYNSIF